MPSLSIGGPLLEGLHASIIQPFWQKYGAVAHWDFTDSSKLIPGATSTDVEGWKDSAVTNVRVSGNLVTNGEFNDSSDLVGWQRLNLTTQALTLSSGGVSVLSTGNADGAPRLFIDHPNTERLTSGKIYRLKFDVTDIEAGKNLRVSSNADVNLNGGYTEITVASIGSYECYIRSDTGYCGFVMGASVGQGYVLDNIEVYELDSTTIAHNLTQTTASAQPTFTQPNGPVVFDGSDYLEGVQNKAGDFTYIIKYKLNNNTNAEILLGESTSDNNILAPQPNYDNIRVRPDSGVNLDFTAVQNKAVEYTLAVVRSGNNYTCYLDGSSLGTQVDNSDFRPDWLGGRQNLSDLINGYIYRCQYYPTALNATQIANITAELNS